MSVEIQLYKGDINVQNGAVQLVNKEDKLIQQASKLLMTQKGGFFHPEYGSNIYTIIGRYQSKEIIYPITEDEVRSVLSYYQGLQQDQEISQEMDDEEVLFRVISVDLSAITSTAFKLDINILSRKGAEVNISTIQGY